MTSPKVSIIIATYGRANLTLETIASIQQQTHQNWELIIVDDGSPDDTEEKVAGLNDYRIRFIKAGRIGITGKIKNIGLANAAGDLIAFLDSDDLWHPSKLEKQVNALTEYPEAGFCLTGGYTFSELGTPIDIFYKQTGLFYGNIFNSIFQSKTACYTQVLMLRKTCLDVSGGFAEEGEFSDVDFIVRLAQHFNAVVLYESLFFRRLHEANYIHATWEKGYHEGIAILRKYKQDLPADIFKDSLFKTYIRFGEKAIRFKKKKLATRNFLKAWSLKPLSIVPLKKIAKAVLFG